MIALFALCVLVCNAAALPMEQTSGSGSSNSQSGVRRWGVCSVNGKELKPGERAAMGSFVYECQLDGENLIRTTIVACLDGGDSKGQNRGEHPVGDRWVEGERPFRYVFECAKSGGVTVKRVAQCSYESTDGSAKLEPGTEQKVGKNVIRCDRMGDNGVRYSIQYGPTDLNPASTNNANANANANTNANTNTGGNGSSSSNVANDASATGQLHKC